MVLVGVVGYTVEWLALGRYHAAHAKHDQKEGLALLAEKKAAHGHGH
jgi:hypothetical protein